MAVGVLFAGIVAALAAAYTRRKLAAWRARLNGYLLARKLATEKAPEETNDSPLPRDPHLLLDGEAPLDEATSGRAPQPGPSRPDGSVDPHRGRGLWGNEHGPVTPIPADLAFDAEVEVDNSFSKKQSPVEWGKLLTGLTMQIAGLVTLDLGLLMWGVVVPEHVGGILSAPFSGGSLEFLVALDTPAQIAIGGYLVGMGAGLLGGGTLLVAKSIHLSSLWYRGGKQP